MNMSFGVQAAPAATGDVGGVGAMEASSTPSVASAGLPPVPSAFSASFTFQGSSAGSAAPPHRPPPPAPAAFSFAGVPPRFTYATPPPPPSASHGFTFQGAPGNPAGLASSQTGAVGQGPAVSMRPFPPTAMAASVPAPPQAVGPPALQGPNPQGSHAVLPGSAATADGMPAQASLQLGTSVLAEAASATSPGSLQLPPTQSRPVTPPNATLPIAGLSGQMQMPPTVGGLAAARPNLPLSTNTTLPYAPRPGFTPAPVSGAAGVPPGVLGSAPAGMAPRFPSPFLPLVRPSFPPRVGAPLVRPPPGALLRPGALIRPDLSKAAGAYLLMEKPQTLVYVGKISSTVDDDFLRSILELCGPIRSWKRAQEPTTGTPKGFGFCEFELPDGVLRALRLLNGFSLEGQELVITVNATTKEYLERFVQKKKEKEEQAKLDASQAAEAEVETAPGVEAPEPMKKPEPDLEKSGDVTVKQEPDTKKFGIVNDEDEEKDEESRKKLTALLEERAKTLPPPPPLPSESEVPGKSTSVSDAPAKSRECDSNADGGKSGGQEVNNEEESIKDKGSSELEKLDTGSSDQGRRPDYFRDKSRDRDRERDRDIDRGRDRFSRERERDRERERLEKEEREEEQSERDREKQRARREKERDNRIRIAERQCENRERDWEREEKEKERRRNVDREKEKEREKLRKRLIKEQEEGTDDDGHKKAKRRGEYDERKRRQKEKEDDEYDRIKEQEEIAEAKQRKLQEEYDEQVTKRLAEIAEKEATAKAAMKVTNDSAKELGSASVTLFANDRQGHMPIANGVDSEVSKSTDKSDRSGSVPVSMDVDENRSSSPPQKKLGFGLIGSGKRTVVPSVFNQEDEEEVPKERALRELVPIDYTVEEMQAVSSLKANTTMGASALNLAAAADYAKSLSNLGRNSARDDQDSDHDKGRRTSDRSKTKERERGARDDNDRSRDREKEKHRQADVNRETVIKLDTKQLIDTIPKTKDELFAYKIDWKIYDQHQLHERMKPWIQKKILEFLGEEEETLVEFIVSNTRKHTGAGEMLTLLTTILDDEAEMFVMKLWRMLIFEVKKIENGLASKSKG